MANIMQSTFMLGKWSTGGIVWGIVLGNVLPKCPEEMS